MIEIESQIYCKYFLCFVFIFTTIPFLSFLLSPFLDSLRTVTIITDIHYYNCGESGVEQS